ncbi:hypothetical protein [Empedobacter sp. GD03739]|uniref:hypothetical protein n=1 Tax=Empedobacter sp. GD03739 TaxID=2975376 RepID=UPI00244D0A7E|nr:hypothetical protein [Empedobacter sp. GD03739]MDH1602232.1 hypothetical protein [Empedobacter sp. GD03739]
MKNIITAILLFVFTNVLAQTHISTSNVFLNNSISLKNNITTTVLKNTIGNPLSTESIYSEIDDANMLSYIYSNARYNFINDSLVSFELNINSIIKINNTIITVGKTLDSAINEQFKVFKTTSQGVEFYKIPLSIDNIEMDYYILININSYKQVSKIMLWYP